MPLIRVKSMSKVYPVGRRLVRGDDYIFYPFYAGQLGRGRIVGGCFAAYAPYPALQEATDNLFILRCVEWLAGRPLRELAETPASQAASDTTTQPSNDARDGSDADFATEAAASHMRLILMNIATYDSEQKKLPKTLDDLVTAKIAPDDGKYVFRNPRTDMNPGFIYVKPPDAAQMADIKSPATTPMLYELKDGMPNPKGLIGYADGHVEMVNGGR